MTVPNDTYAAVGPSEGVPRTMTIMVKAADVRVRQTFWDYFKTQHPVLQFFWTDDYDPIRGYRRRAVVILVFLFTFSLTVIKDLAFRALDIEAKGEDGPAGTLDDLRQLFSDNPVFTAHLGFSIVLVAMCFISEKVLAYIFGLTDRPCCQRFLCVPFKYMLYALAVFAIVGAIVLFVFLRDAEAFLGFLLSWGLYAVVIAPFVVILKYFCFGREEQLDNAVKDALSAKRQEELDRMRAQHAQQAQLRNQQQLQAMRQSTTQQPAARTSSVIVGERPADKGHNPTGTMFVSRSASAPTVASSQHYPAAAMGPVQLQSTPALRTMSQLPVSTMPHSPSQQSSQQMPAQRTATMPYSPTSASGPLLSPGRPSS